MIDRVCILTLKHSGLHNMIGREVYLSENQTLIYKSIIVSESIWANDLVERMGEKWATRVVRIHNVECSKIGSNSSHGTNLTYFC